MRPKTAVLLVLCCFIITSMSFGAVASHGDEQTEFTVEPDNRNPEAEGVTYQLNITLEGLVDGSAGFEDYDRMVFYIENADIASCAGSEGFVSSPSSYTLYLEKEIGGTTEQTELDPDSEAWGNETVEFSFDSVQDDEDNYYKQQDRLVLELEGCVQNPDEGWYQSLVLIEGQSSTDENEAENISMRSTSHYFGICEGCEDDTDARGALGSPPSEQTPTPEPTQSPTPTPTATPIPTATATPALTPTATPTASPTPTDTATPVDQGDESTATETDDGDDEPPISPDVFGMDPFVIVGTVAGISITLAALGARKL